MGTNGWTLSGQDGISAIAIEGPMPNGYDGMVGGGNMGTRWKSLGEGVDWLLLGFFCLFSTPSGARKSLPFFVDFCGTQAPKQWRKAQRLFFCGILSGVAGCI